jgi:hypothetical protein
MVTKEFLGEDLMRSAFDAGNFDVFEDAADVMRDKALSDYERADAFKAVRHGLAGISIEGWQSSIVEPLENPLPTDASPLRYRFLTSKFFPPYDAPLRDSSSSNSMNTFLTHGQSALLSLSFGLTRSFRDFISTENNNHVEGLSVEESFQKLTDYVREGEELGLFEVPDAYTGKEFQWEGFGKLAEWEGFTTEDVRYAVTGSAGNAVRFARVPIEEMMKDVKDTHISRLAVRGMMLRLTRHNASSAQRHSFDGRTTERRKDFEDGPIIQPNRANRPTITWPDKDLPPPLFHQRGANFGTDTFEAGTPVNITTTNRCPAGYTKAPSERMGLQLVSDAIVTYLVEANLDIPPQFMAPKEMYQPPQPLA